MDEMLQSEDISVAPGFQAKVTAPRPKQATWQVIP